MPQTSPIAIPRFSRSFVVHLCRRRLLVSHYSAECHGLAYERNTNREPLRCQLCRERCELVRRRDNLLHSGRNVDAKLHFHPEPNQTVRVEYRSPSILQPNVGNGPGTFLSLHKRLFGVQRQACSGCSRDGHQLCRLYRPPRDH